MRVRRGEDKVTGGEEKEGQVEGEEGEEGEENGGGGFGSEGEKENGFEEEETNCGEN